MNRSRAFAVAFVLIATSLLFSFPWYYELLLGSRFRGLETDSAMSIPAFRLQTLDNTPVVLSDLRGRYSYIFFGYSKCNGICPRALGELYAFAQEAGKDKAAKFQIVFISIDSVRDKPEHLRAFFSGFGKRFLVLRDGADKVGQVARRFGVYYTVPRKAGGETDYQIDHPELVYVLDPSARPKLLYTRVRSGDLLKDWKLLRAEAPRAAKRFERAKQDTGKGTNKTATHVARTQEG